MIISELSYLEDADEDSSIAGGKKFANCTYYPYYDENGFENPYYSYYDCYGNPKKPPKPSHSSSGSSF